MIERAITPHLREMARCFPVVTIMGPRQSGKTTLAKQVFPDHAYVNLEDPAAFRIAASDPKAFFELYKPPVIIDEVPGITFTVEKNTTILVEGIEKDLVGQIAANIRSKRAPEPYKGKGVKYTDEHIRRKEGKKA